MGMGMGSNVGALLGTLPSNVARVQIQASTTFMWVEFVVGFLLCFERFFSGCSGFPLSSKPILCFLLVLSLALRGFSLGPQVFPLLQTNSLFVVGSLPCCERFFSGSSGFPLSSKPILSKSNSICSAPSRLN